MPTLTMLLPELARVERARQLVQWLARGDRLPNARPGHDAALRECFEFIGTTLPVAALTRSLDAGDASGAQWLRADPAYAVADAVTARLMACGELGLSPEESDELARALRPLFGDAGFPLEAPRPDRWYLSCPLDARLPAFADPRDVLGDDLMRHLPRGDNERQWRSLFNEAQVILHNHPVNARRVQRGQVPANSLWFWGAGKLPDWVRTRFAQVASRDRNPDNAAAPSDPLGGQHHHPAPPRLGEEALADAENACAHGGVTNQVGDPMQIGEQAESVVGQCCDNTG